MPVQVMDVLKDGSRNYQVISVTPLNQIRQICGHMNELYLPGDIGIIGHQAAGFLDTSRINISANN
jgi:hypothetical protein